VAALVWASSAKRRSPGNQVMGDESQEADVPTEDVNPLAYKNYAKALKEYVNQKGMVNYKRLKASPGDLEAFLERVAKVDEKTYKGWSRKGRIAFWINAYNAITLKAIIDHYPIKPGGILAKRFPKNSIRQIPGVWDKLKFTVKGREMTLEHLEHKMLRARFNEPRIHVALVCAAKGCPVLRNEPFITSRLDKQLNDQTRRFLKNLTKFRIDRDKSQVHLSPIFKWFGADFVKTFGTDQKFTAHGKSTRAVLNFVSKHLDKKDAEHLAGAEYKIRYLNYDWSLNEQ
jgi:hypothetical protein